MTNDSCDSTGELWNEKGLGFWVAHFYVSKYYEFVDTWIVLLKGREPMLLQTYHHAGIVLLLWGIVSAKTTAAGLVTTVLNSFIHSLMYTYYALSALGVSMPLKRYLTQAQLLQFFVGITITIPTYACVNEAQAASLGALHAYTVVLIYLFYLFYLDSYSKMNAVSPTSKKAGVVNPAGRDGIKKSE
jgi:hypothetical protein